MLRIKINSRALYNKMGKGFQNYLGNTCIITTKKGKCFIDFFNTLHLSKVGENIINVQVSNFFIRNSHKHKFQICQSFKFLFQYPR